MDPIKKAKRRNNKKQAIIHCAMGLIAESGIDSVTTVELAHRLTLTPGALYRYFDSKDHILGAVQLEVIHGLSESLQSTADALAGFSPSHKLLGFSKPTACLRVTGPLATESCLTSSVLRTRFFRMTSLKAWSNPLACSSECWHQLWPGLENPKSSAAVRTPCWVR